MDVGRDLATAEITARVNERYGSCAAKATKDGYEPQANTHIATAFGYTEDELKDIPDRANLGLSCGNPLALANLKEVSFSCGILPPDLRHMTMSYRRLGRGGCRLWQWCWV